MYICTIIHWGCLFVGFLVGFLVLLEFFSLSLYNTMAFQIVLVYLIIIIIFIIEASMYICIKLCICHCHMYYHM